MKVAVKLFSVLMLLGWTAVVKGQADSTQLFHFWCSEGDTLLNDPYCHFCPPDQIVEFWGVKIKSPNNRWTYARHPYVPSIRAKDYLNLTYDVDSTFQVHRLQTQFADDTQLWVDSLAGCPTNPEDTIVSGCPTCPVLDTFEIRDGFLYISLTSMDTSWFVDLREVCELCDSSCIAVVYREYFANVTGDSVIVTVNNGDLPTDAGHLMVYVEGLRQKEGPPGVGDYEVIGSTVYFHYDLEGEDVWVWFFSPESGVSIVRTYHPLITGTVVSVPVIPDSLAQLQVFVEGIKQQLGPPGLGDYQVSGSDLVFNYSLENEDVETWVMDNECSLLLFEEHISAYTGTVLTVTANNGTLPVLDQAVKIWVEGLAQQDGPGGDYQLTDVDQATMKYPLDAEDVNFWFVIGSADVGFLGLFQN